jgi:hypothetical protein
MSEDFNKQLSALQEREREILKKMSLAQRAGAGEQIIGQLNFMLDECRFSQQDLKLLQAGKGKDDFDNFISIG